MEKEHSALAIAITSGKGGVGKTNVTTNLGIALAKSNKRVCILDGDTSLANINILLNMSPAVTFDHYLKGERTLEEVMLSGPKGVQVVPSASGITDFESFTPEQRTRLLNCLEQLESEYDYLLIDTAAGIGESVLQFIEAAQYSVIVISPEPTSLTDAFAMIKVLKRRNHEQPIYILVNMSNGYAHSMEVFKRFAHAVNKHIDTKVRYLGYVPLDRGVQAAVRAQCPFILEDPESPAGRCITLLANILLKHFTTKSAPIRKISEFWKEQLDNVPALEATAPLPEPEPEPEPEIDTATATATESTTDTTAAPTEQEAESAPPSASATGVDVPAAEETVNVIEDRVESANIVDIATNALHKNHISKADADDLLAQLIQHYLTEFGSLPQQAIDLVLQAYDQEQLPETALAQLREQLPHDVASEPTESESSPATVQLQSEIDSLVADASQTKERLTELAEHLRAKYLELYNSDITRPPTSVRAINGSKPAEPARSPAGDDKPALRQSIQFASALDSAKPTARDRNK